jgi:dihydrofolate reductase
MRKIIVTEFITLDGVIESPGDNDNPHPHKGWQFKYAHPETGKYKVDELASADALLLGRKTYDIFSTFWPQQSDEGFGKPINRLPKYVLSQSLPKADWNNNHLIRDLVKDVSALKESEGGNILVYGSAMLVRGLIQHDLVDELHLLLYPVSIGGGLRIFEEDRALKKFELTGSRSFDNGAILLEYRPVR